MFEVLSAESLITPKTMGGEGGMMKTTRFSCVILLMGLMVAYVHPVHGGWNELLNTLKTTVGEGSGLSTEEIVSGLKEALEVGTGKAVETVGKKGGYFLDPEIKILLPESVQKIQGVLKAMSQVGVTRKYQELSGSIQKLPFGESLNLNLDDYVTAGALKGLFYILGQEEKKIRQNPAARGTELLKKVFGGSS